MNEIRRRVHELLAPAEPGDHASLTLDIFLIGLIATDVVCIVIGTVPEMAEVHHERLFWIERGILTLFTVEYFLRLWAARGDWRYADRLGRLRYALTPLALVDLVAILPMLDTLPFLGLVIPGELTSIRVLRVFRILRVGKILRYAASIQVLTRTFWRVRRELSALLVALILFVFISGFVMYGFEGAENREQFGSIPEAMWWAIVTLTTVGYGDQVPLTVGGKLMASLVMIVGIVMFALPAGLLGAAFTEEVTREVEHRKLRRERRQRRAEHLREEKLEHGAGLVCPHCQRTFVPHGPDFRG